MSEKRELTVIKKNGQVQNKYWYDSQGRRVRLWNDQDGYVTQIHSGLSIIFEDSTSGCTKYFYANGLHIAENRSGIIEYYHQDHLGSTRLKTNSTGGTIFSTNYVPFGIQYDSSGSEAFKYTGKYEDSSGLYYFGARYYDPNVGRFITEDPVRGSLTDPQTLNKYVYCRNNPLKYADRNGRVAVPLPLITGAAGAAFSLGIYLLLTPIEQWSLQDALIEAGTGFVGGFFVGLAPWSAATLGLTGLPAAFASYGAPAAGTAVAYVIEKTASDEPMYLDELVWGIGANYMLSYLAGGFSPGTYSVRGLLSYIGLKEAVSESLEAVGPPPVNAADLYDEVLESLDHPRSGIGGGGGGTNIHKMI